MSTVLSVPAVPAATSPEAALYSDNQEVWLNGNRAFIVREVARRINGKITYKVRQGLTTHTVTEDQLSPTRYRGPNRSWPAPEVSAPKARTASLRRGGADRD